jgi:seryl-tRNA synthetase
MATYREPSADQADFMRELVAGGLLIDSGVPGVMGRGRDFERVRVGLDDYLSREFAGEGEPLRFPPLLPRRQLESLGYLKSFPHLAGTLWSFDGSEADAAEQEERATRHEDWSEFQRMTDLVMLPAACYPVYPAVAQRGPLPPGGLTVDPGGAMVFRHEPSGDPMRQQMFHMRELVRLGEPETVQSWRDAWRDRALELLRGLGLDAEFDVAADPFFGRAGRMLASSQKEQELKFEILVPIADPDKTAVASFNYHQDHFSALYGITTADGQPAHTACLGFGHERIVLALLKTHGLDVAAWPAPVREALWGSA